MLLSSRPPSYTSQSLNVNEGIRKSVEQTAWQAGVQRYLSTIPVEFKDALKTPSSPAECVQLLQAAQARNRKLDRLVTIFKPLVEPVKRFEASVDVLVQTYSSVASPIWGPIRLLVTVASTRLATLQSVVILIERLVEPLKRFNDYERLFKDNAALRHAIGCLYCDLIEFCTRVVFHQTKSPFKKTFANYDKDVVEISDKIRHHWAEVDVAANAANLVEAKVAREQEAFQRDLDFQRDVNRWLAPAAVQDDLSSLTAICAAGSCSWIPQTQLMKTFLSDDQKAALRISAYPGGGKSVAAAWVTAHLRQRDKKVIYFFCRSTDAERSFTSCIIRTLVWQLLELDPTLYQSLMPIYNRSGRQIADSEVLAFELFQCVFRSTSMNNLTIVIDALDECRDAGGLVELLTSTQRTFNGALKLLVTSRDDPELSTVVSHFPDALSLQANQQPVITYIENEVQKLPLPISPAQRSLLQDSIINSSDGLWLFASLSIQQLQRATSLIEIEDQLQTVPHGLAQLYSSILKRREQKFSKLQLRMAQQLYLWLPVVDYVPQELWRKQGSSGLDDEVIHIICQFATQSNNEMFDPMDLVLRLCSPLVTTRLLHADHLVTYIEGQPHHCTSFMAEFFHQTAAQYLDWCKTASCSDIPQCMHPQRLTGLQRGACSVWYFTRSEHFEDALRKLQERPRSDVGDCWLEMSCALWDSLKIGRLSHDLTNPELGTAEDLCETLTTFLDSDQCLGFIEASVILHYADQSAILAQNVQQAKYVSSAPTTAPRRRHHFLQNLIDTFELFRADLAYALEQFPAMLNTGAHNDPVLGKPESFEKRPRARKIFALVRKYRWLALPQSAVSINGFSMTGRS